MYFYRHYLNINAVQHSESVYHSIFIVHTGLAYINMTFPYISYTKDRVEFCVNKLKKCVENPT